MQLREYQPRDSFVSNYVSGIWTELSTPLISNVAVRLEQEPVQPSFDLQNPFP
jgi:hypothetical protein